MELFLLRGPVPLIRYGSHQAYFIAPSPMTAATPLLLHDIEEIAHMFLTSQSLHHLHTLNLSVSSCSSNPFSKSLPLAYTISKPLFLQCSSLDFPQLTRPSPHHLPLSHTLFFCNVTAHCWMSLS